MPSVLAIVPGTTLPRRVSLKDTLIEVHSTLDRALDEARRRRYDLLVLGPMPEGGQATAVREFQVLRRWRSIPVLYLWSVDAAGIIIPSAYRPGVDSVARGPLESPEARRAILDQCRRVAPTATRPVLVGPYSLDPARRRLRFDDGEVPLTRREAGLLAVLMSRPDQTVPAGELVAEGWSADLDPQALQTLRRHVSNLRHKLDRAAAGNLLVTVRSEGYCFVSRQNTA